MSQRTFYGILYIVTYCIFTYGKYKLKQLWIYFLYVKDICLITVRKRPYLASLSTEVKQEELQREIPQVT